MLLADEKIQAISTQLSLCSRFPGAIVFPQRGTEEWTDWGFTNAVQVKLEKGTQELTLPFDPANENMNSEINRTMLDYLRLTRIQ
ncbi:hypothetical protein [Rufibacter tibetensis]|uniref:Uncharacterized protein n=1 Tax=Rufibacter tibetensis TaxID=512763 RepID=A0A0P0CEA3_9BACT|nr:hypothetical protein [Rufibacter tibetensis]ALJ00164.1 hypothetical protein DC20_15820 [Rufibacter tibetensis]